MSDPQPIHATLVAFRAKGDWRGVLLRGLSGAGKSDLALRLVGRGWRLVADDRVLAWPSGGRVWGRAPAVLRDRLEIRGVGIAKFPTLPLVEVTAVAEHAPRDALERIPAPETARLCGLEHPALRLDFLETAAADKLAAFCGALRL